MACVAIAQPDRLAGGLWDLSTSITSFEQHTRPSRPPAAVPACPLPQVACACKERSTSSAVPDLAVCAPAEVSGPSSVTELGTAARIAQHASGRRDQRMPPRPENVASSSSSPAPSPSVKWLDRETRAGSSPAAGKDEDKKPLRTDRLAKSYSIVDRKKAKRAWWRLALRGTVSALQITTGTTALLASGGLLASAMTARTVIGSLLISYNSVKLIISGVDVARQIVNIDACPTEPGSTSFAWSTMLLSYATCTALSAYTSFTASIFAGYGSLLQASGNLIASGRVKLAVTKVVTVSATNLHTVLDQSDLGRKAAAAFFKAWDIADSMLGLNQGAQEELVAFGRGIVLLPVGYVCCLGLLIAPPALFISCAKPIRSALARLFHLREAAHYAICRRLVKAGFAHNTPWIAASVQAAAIVAVLKPLGFLGETLYGTPKLFIPKSLTFIPMDLELPSFVAKRAKKAASQAVQKK